jgi:hypothetical protein
MPTREEIVARVGLVTGYVLATLWALTASALVGTVALVGAVFVSGGTDPSSVVLAGLLGIVGVIATVILGLFANDLRPVRRLPEITGAHVRQATGTLATSLAAGEKRFVRAKGLGRVTSLGRALWDLRKDVQTLGDGGLAPAVALFDVLVPTRLLQVGICALAAPFLLFVGLLALTFALALA